MVAARSLAATWRAIPAPSPQQAFCHAHRAHHLGIAQAHLGEAVVARGRLAGFRQWWLNDQLVEQRHQHKKNGAPQRERAECRVQDEDDSDIDRRPGKIENRMDAHAGDKLAEGIEIAQQLAARAAETCRAIDDRRHDPSGDLLVEADAGPCQHASTHRIEPGEREESDQQGNGQHHQRDLAGARDHPVIDL